MVDNLLLVVDKMIKIVLYTLAGNRSLIVFAWQIKWLKMSCFE